MQHHQRQRMAFFHRQRGGVAGIQLHIPHVERAKGACRAGVAAEVPGDHPHLPGAVRQRNHRNIGVQQRLVTRLGHFVLGRQIDPQLHHFHGAALARKSPANGTLHAECQRRRSSTGRRRGQSPAAAGRVAVFHFALIDDGHRFKTAMRMLTHAAGAGGRAEFGWRRVIQQQERAHFRPQIVIREQRIHQKPLPTQCASGLL